MPGSWRERQNRPALSRDSNLLSIPHEQADEIVVRGGVLGDHPQLKESGTVEIGYDFPPDTFSQALDNGLK